MQTQNRILDDIARVAASAMGAVQGARHEVEAAVRARLEKSLAGMDLVTREEFEVVKAMAQAAREENERLAARLAALEAQARQDPPGENMGGRHGES
jgi:BMFP domain-containing protein YqiC